MKTTNIHKDLKSTFQKMAGFTLLELILIMSLVGMVSVGLYSGMTTETPTTKEALLKIAYDIRFAQDRAMVTGRNHGFRNTSTTQYEIYDTSPGSPTTDPNTQTAMTINLTQDYKNVTFPTNYQIEFNSLGSPVMGGGTSVIINNGAVSQNFSVTNNTGLINLP